MKAKLISIFIFTFLIDRITKFWAIKGFLNKYSFFNGALSFDLFFNKGISWSLFESANIYMLYAIFIIILLILFFLLFQIRSKWIDSKFALGEVLVFSGGLSNLIDRILYNGVIDFIILSLKNYTWPVFNLADFFIVIGVLLIFFQSTKI